MPAKKHNLIDSAIIRMYRMGTGDCFALKFMRGSKRAFVMLIDCGSCRGGKEEFEPYIKNLREFVEDHIDLLVVTHEHMDHINGFNKLPQEFEAMRIDHLWLGWTEEPGNEEAKKLEKQYGKAKQGLAMALQQLQGNYKALTPATQTFTTRLEDLLGLYELGASAGLAASGEGAETGKAMGFIRKLVKKENHHYCYPGEVFPAPHMPKIPAAAGLRIYVLGPPTEKRWLADDMEEDEMYSRTFTASEAQSFLQALTPNGALSESARPFRDQFALSKTDAEAYKTAKFGPEDSWRAITYDWLQAAGTLALRLQKLTNNTSLALAIEFEASPKVLLFPGDAQSGNWMSWHDEKRKWRITRKGQEEEITARQLLTNTVFYKVGHHSSHNGTAVASGLECMDDLVAMIPLDTKRICSSWLSTMPCKGLLRELRRRAKGRVFFMENGLHNAPAAQNYRQNLSPTEQKAFEDNYKVEDLYIEFTVHA